MSRLIGSTSRSGSPLRRGRPRSTRFALVLVAAAFTLLAFAAPAFAFEGSPYAGAVIGAGVSTVDEGSVEFHTLDWQPSIGAWRLFAGYGVGKYFGAEAGYVSLGKSRVDTQGGDFFEARQTGFEIAPTGTLPITGGLSGFARVGVVFWRSEIEHQFTALSSGTVDESGSSLALAAGLEYAVVRHVLVRLEGALYSIDKTKSGAGDDKVVMIGARYAF